MSQSGSGLDYSPKGRVAFPKQGTACKIENRTVVGRWFGPSTDGRAGMYQRIKPVIILKSNSSYSLGNQNAFSLRLLLES